jgi:hypothetical protein
VYPVGHAAKVELQISNKAKSTANIISLNTNYTTKRMKSNREAESLLFRDHLPKLQRNKSSKQIVQVMQVVDLVVVGVNPIAILVSTTM